MRPDDELSVESEVLEVRTSQSRPTHGLLKVRTTTRNQHGEAVQAEVGTLVVLRRPAGATTFAVPILALARA